MAKISPLPFPLILILIVPVFLLTLPLAVHAEVVSARVYQENGTTTFIEVKLSTPAPSTLIVEMKLPPGSRIIDSRPRFSKRNKKNHTVKWLLKNARTGSSTIRIITEAELNLRSAQILVRFRDSDDGKLKEIEAQNQ